MKLYKMAGIMRNHVDVLQFAGTEPDVKSWAPTEYVTPDFLSLTLILDEPAVFDIAECCCHSVNGTFTFIQEKQRNVKGGLRPTKMDFGSSELVKRIQKIEWHI